MEKGLALVDMESLKLIISGSAQDVAELAADPSMEAFKSMTTFTVVDGAQVGC